MNGPGSTDTACRAARPLLHRNVDGERLTRSERVALDEHLTGCTACRDASADLIVLRRALRALPESPFPEDALDDVLARTSRRSRWEAWYAWYRAFERSVRTVDWRPALAAGALAVLIWVAWPAQTPSTPIHNPVYGEAEIAQAASELRVVLAMTSRALDRTQQTTIERVLAAEVSPALKRLPIKWPRRKPEC